MCDLDLFLVERTEQIMRQFLLRLELFLPIFVAKRLKKSMETRVAWKHNKLGVKTLTIVQIQGT